MNIKNDNRFKIETKEQLIQLLDKYSKNLDKSEIEYLESILLMNTSVFDEVKKIDKLNKSIYLKFIMYNIYNNLLELSNSIDEKLIVSKEKNLKVYSLLDEKERVDLLEVSVNDKLISLKKNIDICIHQTKRIIINEEMVQILLKNMENEYCPYSDISYKGYTRTNDLKSDWYLKYNFKKAYLEKIIEQKNKKLTDEELNKIELTKKFHDMFLKKYNISMNSLDNNYDYLKIYDEEKKLIKSMPNVNIYDCTNYI